jgi:imidazolonepropionase-like amidohydrolase
MKEAKVSMQAVAMTLALFSTLLFTGCGNSDDSATGTRAGPVSSAVAYTGATVIVGDNTAAIGNATVVVDNGMFVAVGEAGEVAIPPGARVVDLEGYTIMPTIVDTHVHLNRDREVLVRDLRDRARFGVSAALSLGQDEGNDVYAVRDENIPGIAVYRTAGRGITAPEPGRTEIPHWVTTTDEARAAVREEAALDVDIIKIWVDDRDGQYAKLTPDLYSAVIDEAHANGLRVVAHLFTLEDAKGLLLADVDAFAHGVRDQQVDASFMALIAGRDDFVLGPNLTARGTPFDVSWLEGQVSDQQYMQAMNQAATVNDDALAFFRIQARNLARMNAAGVTIVLGTGGNTPWGPHLEMEDMVLAGMSPWEVLKAATGNGASYLGLDDTGTIEEGKKADFIVLEANPMSDITNTRRIHAVYLQGEEIDRSL